MGDRRDSGSWRDAAAQVVVEDLDGPVLDPDDLHHLARVLRLRAGDSVCATDGRGGWRRGTFTGADRLDPVGELHHDPAPAYPVTVGFALVKGERPELVVQKLTELGVDRIVAFSARRSVVRWDAERAERNVLRLRRVAREACGQCRRLWLPQVDVASLDELAAEGGENGGTVRADAGGRPMSAEDRTVLIGPEGGWEDGEVEGIAPVSLGENVLRAETAAIAAATMLTGLRAGLIAPQDNGA